MAKLSPWLSEFHATEEEEAYERRFRAKVQASLDDPRPSIPHDEAMVQIRKKIEAARDGQRLKLGTFLAAIGEQFGDAALNFDRDRTPPDPAAFD